MKTYLVVNATPNPENQEEMKAYSTGVLPLLHNAGGKELRRAKMDTVIKGEAKYLLFLFMEFDNADQVKAVFETGEYQKLLPHRERAFADLNIYTFTDL